MNRSARMVIAALAALLIFGGLAWTNATGITTADKQGSGILASSEATTLADENKIVCCWKCPDDGLMKCKVTSASFCKKMGRQVSSCGECK